MNPLIEFLYNIFIFPIIQIIEISFTIVQRISQNYIVAIVGVSAVVTVCTMPLYFFAEKWQEAERELQKKLKPKVDKIKSVFKGDEQYMVLSAYYRQNHYHPLYALRNSLSVLIQVPFFIAAYSYLSHLNNLKGISFLFIQDLSAPDRFLSLGGFSLNILPILMTLINWASGTVYTRGLAVRDKVQVYGIALVFLVLLYNSPSGLVLYWTMNNIFSLAKNVLAKIKYWKEIVYCFGCLCVLLVIVRYALIGFNTNRLVVSAFFSLFFFIPLFFKLFKIIQNKIAQLVNVEESSLSTHSTYILSVLILFILSGIAIPSALVGSSVQEFSFIESYTSPLPFIFNVCIQAAGIFLFWPICVYFLFSKKVKYGLSLALSLLCIAALVNTFLFPLNYGDFTTAFRFSDPETISLTSAIINGVIVLCILGVFTCLLLNKRKFIFHSFQLITLSALVIFSAITLFRINHEFKDFRQLLAKFSGESSLDISPTDELEPIYHFSKHGKNVVVLMLDGAISGYVPYIFDEKAELNIDFSGFTYYPNCVSLGRITRFGMPPIFGGYEYKPENISKDYSYAREKHNEALMMMPITFLNENYRITVTDPTYANYSHIPDLSIFASYPGIYAYNIRGNYTNKWMMSHPEVKARSIIGLSKELLIRFSFLKTSSPVFRVLIYDRTRWLKIVDEYETTLHTLDRYTTLDYLPALTEISDDNANTYTAMVNDLTHDPAFFQYPDYVPAMKITNIGNGPLAKEKYYHSNMAAFLLIKKWLNFLQEEGIYDNSRIIIVSDHGRAANSKYAGNILLPDKFWLSECHSLLLVKDFNSHGNMVTDNTFMTHADVPLIAMNGLIDNPINPFSGNNIQSDKDDGIFISTTTVFQRTATDDQWLYVHDNIFDPNNWEKVRK